MEIVQPEASVVIPGLNLRYIGSHAYGYSGVVSVSTSETSLLEFDTGSGFVKAEIQITSEADTDNDFASRLYVNDIQVVGTRYLAAYPAKRHGFDRPLFFLVPPNSKIKITQQLLTGGGGNTDWYCTLVGRVYGAK